MFYFIFIDYIYYKKSTTFYLIITLTKYSTYTDFFYRILYTSKLLFTPQGNSSYYFSNIKLIIKFIIPLTNINIICLLSFTINVKLTIHSKDGKHNIVEVFEMKW